MTPKYIDIHSHINFPDYDADRQAVLTRMKEAGVWTITVGTDLESSRSAVALAEENAGGATTGDANNSAQVFACIGLHPHDNIGELGQEFAYDEYKKLAQHPRVVAIGECGLDYSRFGDLSAEERAKVAAQQAKIFRAHIALADELQKPLMLHIRPSLNSQDAYEDAHAILVPLVSDGQISKAQVVSEVQAKGRKISGNVHFFAGNWQTAQKFLALGFTLSFTGVITFARSYDEVIRNAPLDMILSETDCPFVTPAPYRGKRNEPAYVANVVDKIAEIRGLTDPVSKEKLAAQLVSNVKRVFGI